MPSSTSSFERFVPDGRWGKTWILTLFGVVSLLALWEAHWKVAGFVPSTNDNAQAWVAIRSMVRAKSTVLIGTSRSQAAIDPRVWKAELNTSSPPLQLSIAGSSALPVLEDLAKEERFAGLVLVDMVPRIEFDATREREKTPLRYLGLYHATLESPAQRCEVIVRRLVPNLVMLNPAVSPRRLAEVTLGAVRRRSLDEFDQLSRPYYTTGTDRFIQLDFRRTDADALKKGLLKGIAAQGTPALGRQLRTIGSRFDRAVSVIQDRGGVVVFVRFPSCGEIRELEAHRYPRTQYWDGFAQQTPGVTIHSSDYPALSCFPCPDGSHLDVRDRAAFTKALVGVVKAAVKRKLGGRLP